MTLTSGGNDLRDLTEHERAVLGFLLDGEWDGAAALREQLASAKHAGLWRPASASFYIAVAADVPRAAVTGDSMPECVVSGSDGRAVGELFLKVEDGVLVALECSTFDGDPSALPPLEWLVSHADFDLRGCTPF